MDDSIRSLIFQAIDQTISAEDFDRLQDAIEQSDEVRAEYLTVVSLCESLSDISADDDVASSDQKSAVVRGASRFRFLKWNSSRPSGTTNWPLRFAIAGAFPVVFAIAFMFGVSDGVRRQEQIGDGGEATGTNSAPESVIAGHATLRRSVDVRWAEKSNSYREGDVLPAGVLQFDQGVAEIDFFCGATLIVEGPATLNVESDWLVRVARGRLRANVPPAARGFMVTAAGSTIVDLGTEFALDVGAENAHVEVIDGEVELRGGVHDGSLLTTGQKRWLRGAAGGDDSLTGLSTIGDVRRRRDTAQAARFAQWKMHSQQLRTDDRLIAYYPILESQSGRQVPNQSATGSERDGQTVGLVNRVTGRFGAKTSGFEFDRPGSRVRVRIDGEFQAFTFACWVKIDSLEHRYNALFMGDGYENGEPHWQVRDDGRLMFSVMVDDTLEIEHFSEVEQRVVNHAGLHRVYYSEPFWDISQSGQWFHIAAVYDPAGRQVVQYVNGEELSRQEIVDKFHISTLRIGAAEIGNWGQPFRKSPWFAVRNLNGAIDELAIFNAALTSDEMQNLYEQGRPLGY
jgi:hypothetical protein